jgi:hypothetical protein
MAIGFMAILVFRFVVSIPARIRKMVGAVAEKAISKVANELPERKVYNTEIKILNIEISEKE